MQTKREYNPMVLCSGPNSAQKQRVVTGKAADIKPKQIMNRKTDPDDVVKWRQMIFCGDS